jgi:hypothetical protein
MTIFTIRSDRGHVFTFTLALLAAACQSSSPTVTTETVPGVKVESYRTFGFPEQPSTDAPGSTTPTTRYLKEAVTKEMVARGYELSNEPELLVDFVAAISEQGEQPAGSAVSVGSAGGSGGVGINMGNVLGTKGAEGVLRIDVIDRKQRQVIWGGSIKQRVAGDQKEYSQAMIYTAVSSIFAKYPKPVVATMQSSTEQPPK